jgi:hypothetical protein
MHVLDFVSSFEPVEIATDSELRRRLQTGWHEGYAAFIFSHKGPESLFVNFHEEAAYLWYVPDEDGQHPGFIPVDMWKGPSRDREFRILGGGSEPIFVPWQHLLEIDAACEAAREFLHSSEKPRSISWMELC